jgi:hypothetical protein
VAWQNNFRTVVAPLPYDDEFSVLNLNPVSSHTTDLGSAIPRSIHHRTPHVDRNLSFVDEAGAVLRVSNSARHRYQAFGDSGSSRLHDGAGLFDCSWFAAQAECRCGSACSAQDRLAETYGG